MSIQDFCDFFDFTFEQGEFFDEDGNKYKYRATDNQEVFHTRYENNIENFADDFDSMLLDYVDTELEEQYGFEPLINVNYYEQAEKWLEMKDSKDTSLYKVIRVLNNPSLLYVG